MRTFSISGVIGGLALSSSAIAVEPPAVDPQAITVARQWTQEFNQGDASRLAGLYAHDAVLMPPSDETLISREAIEAYWKRTLQGLSDYSVDIVQSRAEGNVLYAAGIWSANVAGADGKPVVVGGNVLRVMERQEDGSWKLRVETWN